MVFFSKPLNAEERIWEMSTSLVVTFYCLGFILARSDYCRYVSTEACRMKRIRETDHSLFYINSVTTLSPREKKYFCLRYENSSKKQWEEIVLTILPPTGSCNHWIRFYQ